MQRLNARTSKVKHTQDAVPAGNSSKLSGNNVFQSAMVITRLSLNQISAECSFNVNLE